MPVIVCVASRGTVGLGRVFITNWQLHIAAMAPGTNIGAAHPVSLQGPMDSIMGVVVNNHAAAFIRSIAEKENEIMGQNSVRKSFAYSETEALMMKRSISSLPMCPTC